jgi:hypothetical protein
LLVINTLHVRNQYFLVLKYENLIVSRHCSSKDFLRNTIHIKLVNCNLNIKTTCIKCKLLPGGPLGPGKPPGPRGPGGPGGPGARTETAAGARRPAYNSLRLSSPSVLHSPPAEID